MKRFVLYSLLIIPFGPLCVVRAWIGGTDLAAIQQHSATAASSSPTPDLGWWKFNDNTGTTAVDACSGTKHDMTLAGTWVTGKAGKAIQGDGSGTIGMTLDITYATNKLTVCAWFLVPTFTGSQTFYDTSTSGGDKVFRLTRESFGVMRGQVRGGWAATFQAFDQWAAGEWHHVACVFDNSVDPASVLVYVDGSQTTPALTTDTTGIGVFTTKGLALGSDSDGNNPVACSIDDLRIYSGALSSAQITSIYNDPK